MDPVRGVIGTVSFQPGEPSFTIWLDGDKGIPTDALFAAGAWTATGHGEPFHSLGELVGWLAGHPRVRVTMHPDAHHYGTCMRGEFEVLP